MSPDEPPRLERQLDRSGRRPRGAAGIPAAGGYGSGGNSCGHGDAGSPQNIVILIRINSPGDNGPIEQTNTAVAASNAGNVSATTQGGSGNASAEGTATGASPDTRAAIGPPAHQDATPAAALPRMSVALLAPAAPRAAIARSPHR